jgi:hypothetical protein
MDPADVFDLDGKITGEFIFYELERLGLPLSAMQNPSVQKVISDNWVVEQRADRIGLLCQQLWITTNDDQLRSIAKCSLVSHEMFPEGMRLSTEERLIATEVQYHALKSFSIKKGYQMSEDSLRTDAANTVAFGEKGITVLHKIGKLIFGS